MVSKNATPTLNYQIPPKASQRSTVAVLIDSVCGVAMASWGLICVICLAMLRINTHVNFRPQNQIAIGWTRIKSGKAAAKQERARMISLKQLQDRYGV